MTVASGLAQRTRLRAFRARQYVLIIVDGELPTPGFDVDIVQSPLQISPPQFTVLRRTRPGIWPQRVTPYREAMTVRFPEGQSTVTIHHADGTDQVDIEKCGEELDFYLRAVGDNANRPCPQGADEATGFSKKLSFEEAFANARANLPPAQSPVADSVERIQVLEIGALYGGIAGFRDMFVRICRTHD
ncbi:MAG: hypothetical protein JO364_17085 [Pseudonocardiales bacterium]|nr:hypothetical protein [Pseudonocardiales bacterium]MBV9031975.1 hypothetical protein [Pseudonocardiales bacterium]